MADEDSKEKRRLQNRESQRRFRQRRQFYQGSSNARLNEEQGATGSTWPPSMPSAAFYPTSVPFQNERRSSISTSQNESSAISPIHASQTTPRATQNWGSQRNLGAVGSVASPAQSAPQQFQSQQTTMAASQAPVIRDLPIVNGPADGEAHSLPLTDLEEQRHTSVSMAQPLLPSFGSPSLGRTEDNSTCLSNEYSGSGELSKPTRYRQRRLRIGGFSRAEEMVLDVERLHNSAVDLGILEEDDRMLTLLREMRMRLGHFTRRLSLDDEDDLMAQEFDIDLS
ncbi:hypothetical protein PFICI_00023 [Pestalotiopsis fici W106-1]|uniref:BZIP domain-containing protein n=1 Tax=Pestalotiopsis fici (strain W106-1 / CGMCC3.15140) TaxID=1229662 RepID=W3XJJ9_PESFW|nr:uncharacterized protein PFICI_00023 [Pestalotiopsis fici W106-1]ETS86195.1 hypothetical protein PFICI_00023 [Pestalotiopsis fici W106-1]